MDKAGNVQRKVADACRRGNTPTAVLTAVKEALQQDVPADRWCAMSLDPATSLPTGGMHEHGFSPEHAPRLLELEFGGGDVNSLSSLARGPQAVATLAAATQGDRSRSARFREVMAPGGRHTKNALAHGFRFAAITLELQDDHPIGTLGAQALEERPGAVGAPVVDQTEADAGMTSEVLHQIRPGQAALLVVAGDD